jgi:very-short-patch-repair endonuclease
MSLGRKERVAPPSLGTRFYTPLFRIADFYLPEMNLIIEIDGSYHDPEKGRIKDERFLRDRGIRTLRLTNDQVLSGRIPRLD